MKPLSDTAVTPLFSLTLLVLLTMSTKQEACNKRRQAAKNMLHDRKWVSEETTLFLW